MSSDTKVISSPKSQIKLTQIINSNGGGAVAAVPQYYTRKQLPAQNSPQIQPQLVEISSQQQLSPNEEQLKMQITNLRNVVHAKKQTQILSARNSNSNNGVNFAAALVQENLLTPRVNGNNNAQQMIQIREDSSKRLKQLVANASQGINRRAQVAAAQQKASSTPRGALQSRQTQEANQDEQQPNSTTGSQNTKNREINNAYLKKRLPNGIQLVNYQEKNKSNIIISPSNVDIFQNKQSPQPPLTDRKRDSANKISIDGGNIPSDSEPNEGVIRAVKESLKLIRKNGTEEQIMSRRKQSQKKFQNQQHAIVHGSSSNEGGNSTDRGGQGTNFLASSEISGSLGSASNVGINNMPALSGSMSMKNAQKGFISSKGINLPEQHPEIKLEFPYSNDRGIIAQVHIKLEDQNYKVYKNSNNNNQSPPPMVASAQQSNLIMKLKQQSQKKGVMSNSGGMRHQGFQSQDFQNLPQQISPLNQPLQLSSGSLNKLKRGSFPTRFPPETPRNNLSQLVPPMGGNNGGNAGDMKKSTSKLNLKQILVTDQRSQVQSIEDVHFVRVYSNIKQREILNKSDSVIPQAASKFSNNHGQGGVRTKFDSKVQVIEELEKSLSIDY